MDAIFCIDHSTTIRRIVQDCIEDLSYIYYGAENGEAGLNMLPSIPNLKMIILDWNMPGMSGRDTLRRLRENDIAKHLIILVIIRVEQKDQVMEAIDIGATNYILKPFSVNALQDKIQAMMTNAV